MREMRTTVGPGFESVEPTVTKQNDANPHPNYAVSRGAGNLALVNAAGTVTITSTSLPWLENPEVGADILVSGFSNADNNGRFTITSSTGYTVVFTNSSGVNETITSTTTAIRLLRTPVKCFQDVTMTSGVPTYAKVDADSTLTVSPVGGVYTYLTCVNTTDADCLITVAGGTLICPADGAIGHEIKPFKNTVTAVATGATTGSVYLNIS